MEQWKHVVQLETFVLETCPCEYVPSLMHHDAISRHCMQLGKAMMASIAEENQRRVKEQRQLEEALRRSVGNGRQVSRESQEVP